MEVVASKKQLQKAVEKVLTGKSKTLAVLDLVELKAEGDTLTIKGSDLENFMAYRLQVQVLKEGSAYVKKQDLMKMFKAISDNEVKLTVEDNYLKITTETSTLRITAETENHLDKLDFNGEVLTTIAGVELLNGLKKSTYAASKTTKDFWRRNPSLENVCFHFKDYLNIVSTDGHRMSIYKAKHNTGTKEDKYILSLTSVKVLEKIIDKKETIKIMLKDRFIGFEGSNWILYSMLLDIAYPDYELVIPKGFNLQVKIEKDKLLQAVKPFEKLDEGIIIYSEGNELRVKTTPGSEWGEVDKLISYYEYKGAEFEFCINPKYLIEAVNKIEDEYIIMGLIDKESVIRFIPLNPEEHYMALVMPIKLN